MFNMCNIKTSCDNCAHLDICRVKKNFEELKTTTDDLAKLLENKEFNITVSCKHYQSCMGNIR